MPFNITSPNSAKFNIQFTDQFNTPTMPTSGSVTLTYLINGTANSSTIDLSLVNGFWTATWSSVGVDVPSDVFWVTISSLSFPNPAQVGTIRIIDP